MAFSNHGNHAPERGNPSRRPGKVNRSVSASVLVLAAACLAALSAGLAGCDKEEGSSDQSPPDHMIKAPKSQGKWRFGVTDTIAIEFDENIDTAALSLGFSDSAGRGSRITGLRKAQIFGTKSLYGGGHFPVNTPFTLTLRGLQDRWGNGRSEISEVFQPYPWADRDFLDTTYDWYDTLFLGDAWVDGTPVSDTLLVEGSLDYKQNFGRRDQFDYPVFKAGGLDTVSLFLTCRKDLAVEWVLAGPFKPATFDSVLKVFDFDAAVSPASAEGTKILARSTSGTLGRVEKTLIPDLKDHRTVLGSFDAQGYYVLRLSVAQGKEGFYRLGLRNRKLR